MPNQFTYRIETASADHVTYLITDPGWYLAYPPSSWYRTDRPHPGAIIPHRVTVHRVMDTATVTAVEVEGFPTRRRLFGRAPVLRRYRYTEPRSFPSWAGNMIRGVFAPEPEPARR